MFKYSHVPAYSFGKSHKPEGLQAVPGPGAYDPDKADKVTRKADPTSVKLKPGREYDGKGKNPVGPGQYDPLNDNWKATLGKFPHAERGRQNDNQVPGPGQYDYDVTEEKLKVEKKNVVFGKESRNKALKESGPGPGQYQSTDTTARVERYRAQSGYKWDKSARDGMYRKSEAPGPGTYEAKPEYVLESTGKSYSLGKASGKRPVLGVGIPGPGAYDPNELTASGNIKFGKMERVNPALTKRDVPGPGQYDPDQAFSKLTSPPGVKFPKSSQHAKENAIPGPGNYDPKVSALEKRAVAMPKEPRGKMRESGVPGPGQYDNNVDLSVKTGNFKFGKEVRGKSVVTLAPGPGTYDANLRDGKPTFKMGKDVRLKDRKNDLPGPGQYDPDGKPWDKHFPKFGHSGALNTKGLDVGPGMYQVPHSIPDVPRYNYPSEEKRKIKI